MGFFAYFAFFINDLNLSTALGTVLASGPSSKLSKAFSCNDIIGIPTWFLKCFIDLTPNFSFIKFFILYIFPESFNCHSYFLLAPLRVLVTAFIFLLLFILNILSKRKNKLN